MTVHCHYCDVPAILVNGNVIYPHRPDLVDRKFYLCPKCGAYVGCHRGTTNPLGILARAELRALKQCVHAQFDPLWRKGSMSRSAAYHFLARGLGIAPYSCHIGMFDEARCRQALRFLSSGKRMQISHDIDP